MTPPKASAKVGGEGTSRASWLRFGRKGDKGLTAAGWVGRPSGRCTHTTAGGAGGTRGRGRGLRGRDSGDPRVLTAWEGAPGKNLAPAWRSISGASLWLPRLWTPEMAAALRLPSAILTGVSPVGRLRPQLGGRRGQKRKRGWGGGGDGSEETVSFPPTGLFPDPAAHLSALSHSCYLHLSLAF